MKYFILIIMSILNICSFGQNKKSPVIDFEIILRFDNHISRKYITFKQADTFQGSIYSKENYKKMDFSVWEGFFFSFSEIFKEKYDNPGLTLDNGAKTKLLENDLAYKALNEADKILVFYITPIDFVTGADSVNCYCKTAVFAKKKSIGEYKFNYDISFGETFFKIPLNKAANLDFVTETFPGVNASGIFKIRKITPPEQIAAEIKSDSIEAATSPEKKALRVWSKDIVEAQKKNELGSTKLKMGMEYIETDNKGKEISFRKLNYPLTSYSEIPTKESAIKLSNNYYSGYLSIPFRLGDKIKEKKLSDLGLLDKSYKEYQIVVIPVNKKGDVYTLDLLIETGMVEKNGRSWFNSFGKRITLKLGDTIKLDIRQNYKMFRKKYGGYIVDLQEDFYKYSEEYLLFSLEGDK